MAYTTTNFKTKKAVREAIAEGKTVTVYNPGLGGEITDGKVYLEMENGRLVKVK